MSHPNNESRLLYSHLRGTGTQATSSSRPMVNPSMHQGSRSRGTVSCGACKHLKKKCEKECIFAPYFDPEHGVAPFAAIHRVFGARKLAKLLEKIPPGRRHEAVRSLYFEAQAREHDLIGGCHAIVENLSHQVTSLQADVARLENELRIARLNAGNALQGAPQLQPVNNLVVPPGHHLNNFQPMHPNGSFAPNNSAVNMNMFDPNLSSLASQNPNVAYGEQIVNRPPVTEPFYNVDEFFNDVEEDTFVFPNQMF